MSGTRFSGSGESAEALKNRGNAALNEGDPALAEKLYRQAVAADPDYMPAHYNLGNVLRQAGRYGEALVAYQAAARLDPADYEIEVNVGVTLTEMARYADAIKSFSRATALAPTALEPLLNNGVALERSGRHLEAIEAWSKLLEQHADCSIARYYRSMAYLRLGRWQEGFADYESRLDLPDALPENLLQGKLEWDGSPLAGKTLLIFPEQGIGDMIQLLRYVPLCKAAGARVMVCCHPPLAGLLATVTDIDVATPDGVPLPEAFDAWISVMSLPHACGHHPELPPLRFDVRAATRPAIAAAPGLKVGVCRRQSDGDGSRAIAGSELARHLAGLDGITFFGLQTDAVAADFATPVMLWMEDLLAVAQTLLQFDLVITADAAIAHICGSLGLPTWVLATTSPDWCWGVAEETTPWYPGVRIFRQTAPGDWSTALTAVGDRLRSGRL